MTIMRPIRSIATALLVASLAVTGCGRSQPDQAPPPADQPPAVTAAPAPKAPAPTGGPTTRQPVVLVDGRHPVYPQDRRPEPQDHQLRPDPVLLRRDEAAREAAKDHPSLARQVRQWVPNDVYIRNVNPRLRTLPVPADATITVITLAWGEGPADSQGSSRCPLPSSRPHAAPGSMPFSITVRHGQVVRIAELFVP